MADTETLVTVQINFPTVDRSAVADLTVPVMQAAVAAGGTRVSISVQGYDPEADDT